MKKSLTLLLIISAAGLLACGNNPIQNKTKGTIIQWRGDRTGIFHETGLKTSWHENQPQLLWYFDELGEGHSSPAIANGRIFVKGKTDGIGSIFVFDLNGNLLNQREYGAEWNRNFHGTRGTITPSGNYIYFISGEGVIYCFDQRSLRLIWFKNLLEEFDAPNIVWGITESPLIVGDKVIATPGGREHNVVALNKHTGELVWSSPGMGCWAAYCSPMFIDSQEVPIIVQMTGAYTIGIHADTGEVLWSHFKINRYPLHANTPLYHNGMLLLTTGASTGSTMLRLIDGGRAIEEVWRNELLDNRMGGVVRVGNYIYGSGHWNRYWFCINWYTGETVWQKSGLIMPAELGSVEWWLSDEWDTGEIRWQEEMPSMGITISADGMLFIYSDRGEMVLARASPLGFNIAGRFPITLGTDQHISHPIIYNGMLLVRRGNTIMAFDVKK